MKRSTITANTDNEDEIIIDDTDTVRSQKPNNQIRLDIILNDRGMIWQLIQNELDGFMKRIKPLVPRLVSESKNATPIK